MSKKQDESGISKKTSAQKWADAVTINDNSNQRGIELRFNAEPSPKLQPKLRAMGFRHSKSQIMWYGENTQQAMDFARKVEAILPSSPEGPDLFLSPTFDAVKTNIEKKEFSYVMITLKNGQTKSYIVFEPSKPKAEVIAGNFALETFGDEFLALAAKPRLHTKEARVLFDEGKIIFPEGKQQSIHKESSIKGLQKESSEQSSDESIETFPDNQRETERLALDKFYKWATLQQDETIKPSKISKEQFEKWFKDNYPKFNLKNVESIWQSHQRILKSLTRIGKHNSGKGLMQPYSTIYSKLLKVIPDLIKYIQEGKYHGKSEKDPDSGLMNLNYDFVREDKNGNYIIALSHYFEQNGDMVADPDMQIRLFPEQKVAEAMAFQDQFGYKEVYQEKDGKEYVDLRRKKDLNSFLNQWLTNIINQGHKIDLSKEESDDEIQSEVLETNSQTTIDFNRLNTPEEEKEIIEQFLAQGYKRPFRAIDAYYQQMPVIDVAFRYDEPTQYFRKKIEKPKEEKIAALQKELKALKGKDANKNRELLQSQIDKLKAEITKAEQLINEEAEIFHDDLFQVILDKAREKGHAVDGENEIVGFRDYVMTNILDNRIIENYHRQPVNELIDELIDEYFSKDKKLPDTERPSAGTEKTNVTDLKSGDTFIPNVLVPSGTMEPFNSHLFQMYDMTEVLKNNFPHLLKLSDKNLETASPIALFELLQFAHPSEYGIDVSRQELLKKFEKHGKSIFQNIGFPTDDLYPYVNLYLGYESIEPLKEMLFDNNKEGDEWWAIAENARPIADATKAIKLINQMIAKEKQEMQAYVNSKTGKPKLDSKHLVRDIELTIESFESSKKVLQNYLDNPSTNVSDETSEIQHDILANENGVYTLKTAGKKFEKIEIPIPKGAQYEASIAIVETSKGDYTFGINADKKFGDSSGTGFAPSMEGTRYSTKIEALEVALKQHELRLEVLLSSKDSILNNEEKKNKQLNMALNAVKSFAEENGIELRNESAMPSKNIIKGLENTYWTKEDDQYPVNKAVIKGMEFNQARLRETIRTKLERLPINTLEEIVKELAFKFKERRPLSTYENGLVTIEKTGSKRKATIIASYIDDMVIDNDLSEGKKHSVLTFLLELLFSNEQQLVDLPQNVEKSSTPKAKKQSQFDLNKEIEALIDTKDKAGNSFSEEEKNYIRQYTGAGGLLKEGATGRGALYEYYTPELVVKKMWEMAYHYGYDGGSILEPSVGTGNFLKYAPKNAIVIGYETNHYSARITQILYPFAQIKEKAFESIFFAGNVHLKNKFENPGYSLVIGNPPYGEFTGKYAGMGEKQYTGATEYDQYFMLRGLDLLKNRGLLVFLIPSSFITNQSKFNKVKEKIASKADVVDLYRLPSRIFETTDIGTDILVLRKTND
ncbi:MAG: DUF1249 domain-containing protein [Bacteroidetes bacterium]|nr:DUF1249 domain-containing protein [Bacteroidota bacterium]